MNFPQPPILLIDVDGVISLFGGLQTGPATDPTLVPALVDGVPHFLSRRAAVQLGRLASLFECVWCTGWEERAEEHLPRLLDLPGGWPHLRFSEFPVPDAHWKLSAIDAHAGHRAAAGVGRRRARFTMPPMGRRAPRPDPPDQHRSGRGPDRCAGPKTDRMGRVAQERSVRTTTSGGRRKRSGSPAVPTPVET